MSTADHPAVTPIALIVNAIHNRKIKGTPRAIAEMIISKVFEHEAERWDESETLYEGGIEYGSRGGVTEIKQTGSTEEGTHRRKVLVFYGPWEEGSPAPANRLLKANPLTGEPQ